MDLWKSKEIESQETSIVRVTIVKSNVDNTTWIASVSPAIHHSIEKGLTTCMQDFETVSDIKA